MSNYTAMADYIEGMVSGKSFNSHILLYSIGAYTEKMVIRSNQETIRNRYR